jgi:tetratricopeptide (TPR) repeat protein
MKYCDQEAAYAARDLFERIWNAGDFAVTTIGIFLSSTSKDLAPHRVKACDVVGRMGQLSVRMESFGAQPSTPIDTCRNEVRASDALIVIVGHRYGWVPSKEQGGDGIRSITWLEVQWAMDAKKPVFAFLIDENAPWHGEKEQDRLSSSKNQSEYIEVGRSVKRIQDFRNFLEQRATRDRFISPEDLGAKIATSLHKWLMKKSRVIRETAMFREPASRLDKRSKANIKSLVSELMQSRPRPTLVFGSSGMGKSTIIRAGIEDSRVSTKYGDRIFFVHCNNAHNAATVMHRIAASIGVVEPGLIDSAEVALNRAHAILVLYRLDAPAQSDPSGIEELLNRLAALPRVALIGAARDANITYEARWQSRIKAEPLSSAEARDLFLRIADIPDPDVAGVSIVEDILRELYGVPLAIELVGRVVRRERDLGMVLHRLRAERRLRAEKARFSLIPHHASKISVGIATEVSMQNITSYAARLLSVLACLPGGLAHSDLGVLLPDVGYDAASILRQQALAFDEGGRLRAPDAVRDAVAENHEASHEDLGRLSIGHQSLLSELTVIPKSGGGNTDLGAVAREAPNISFILRRELPNIRRHTPEIARLLIRNANGYGNYLFLLGLNKPGGEILELGKRAAEEMSDRQATALASLNLARIEEKLGNYSRSREQLESCGQPLSSDEDYVRVCASRHILGILGFNQCRYHDAMLALDDGFTLLDNVNDSSDYAYFKDYLRCDLLERKCVIAIRLADHDKAQGWGEEGLRIAKYLDDPIRKSVHLKNLCWLRIEQGKFAAAERLGKRGLEYARRSEHRGEISHHSEVAGLCSLLARAARLQNRPAEVLDLLNDALASAERARHRWYRAFALIELGEHHLSQPRIADARGAFTEACAIAEKIGASDLRAEATLGNARAAMRDGDAVDVARLAQDCLRIFAEIGL